MEHTHGEVLTRAAILERLKKRELHVPNADKLSIDQLEQIYKNFIVPQPRRDRRERTTPVADSPQKSLTELSMDMEQLPKRTAVASVPKRQRSQNWDCQTPHNSCVTKRLKIEEQR